MSGVVTLLLALVAGVGLGLLYFGGLWLTVRRLATSRRPALLFGTSLVVRLALTVLGFYFVMDGSWPRALACLGGFLIARQILTYRLRPEGAPAVAENKGGVQP
ncbi:MAG: ATP synthase subunit I [Sphingomonadaceae bacterium]